MYDRCNRGFSLHRVKLTTPTARPTHGAAVRGKVKHPVKSLLTITAVIEAGTGAALAIAPDAAARMLLGSPLDSPAASIIARVLAGALFALGMACWLARGDDHGRATVGLVASMLLYNIAATSLLVHARIGLGMSGPGLWPGAILHAALAVWCVACLRAARPGASVQ